MERRSKAAAHHWPAEQCNQDSSNSPRNGGNRHASAQAKVFRPPDGKPRGKADRCPEQAAFGWAGDVARGLTQKQAEGVQSKKFDDCSDEQPAERSAEDAPLPWPIRSEARGRDPKGHAQPSEQGHDRCDRDQNQEGRDCAHALSSSGEPVEQSAENPGNCAADRPCNAEDGEFARRILAPDARPRRPGIARRNRRNEAIAMLRDGLDEARIGCVVAELPAEGLDALRQRLVRYRNSPPDLVEETGLGNEPALLAHQQYQRVEVTAVQLHWAIAAEELPVWLIEREVFEAKGAGRHFSANPHVLLMPFTGCPSMLKPASMHGGKGMTMNGEIAGEPRGTLFRAAGWGIATALLILPMVATQFMPEVQWTTSDFIVWGIMLATVGGLFELAVRLSPLPSYRAGFGLALLGAFLVVWTNLAVGIVGSEHNPANALFFAALAVGIAGATISRLRASGMAKAMFATAIALGVAFAIALLGPTDEIDVPASREALGTGFFALLFVASGLLFRRAATHSSSSS